MARAKAHQNPVHGTSETTPPGVPDLAVAAQLLARPLQDVERAAQDVEPYRHQDGYPVWSLRQLALALGLVEPNRTAGAEQGNGPSKPRS
jgi:hypothetical protein